LYCADVLGGITLISVKDDADIVAYRGKSKTLTEYMQIHAIPKDMAASMEAHLRLHFANEEVLRMLAAMFFTKKCNTIFFTTALRVSCVVVSLKLSFPTTCIMGVCNLPVISL
jgi:hypothetical protein